MVSIEEEELIYELYDAGIVKFGQFQLKDGSVSPFYIDLRLLVSDYWLLDKVSDHLVSLIIKKGLGYNYIAGIPLAGIPLATAVGIRLGAAGLLLRKNAKDHGTKQMIEGKFNPGEQVLLIDDVVTSGESKVETISMLGEHRLVCTDVVVVIDRRNNDFCHKLNIHSLFTIKDILETLLEYRYLKEGDRNNIKQSLKYNG